MLTTLGHCLESMERASVQGRFWGSLNWQAVNNASICWGLHFGHFGCDEQQPEGNEKVAT